ncbi:cell adhesion molecule DSCAM-like isoform X3 [Argiope bruennichi]|uniref:cell adhesion molecule DSCAM-like isoform X3 n=1 Tax=Argiope bruennichi TaxID=94029 RepID=UPI002494294B|nr:cell adhesion molecule DSCAM-like isoform X3 [Argiope bruennichi]
MSKRRGLEIQLTVARSDRNPVGPRFTIEPPGKVQFYNSTGAVVTCAASGVPLPTMSWIRQDGTPVQEVPELLQIRPDASLVFSPFRPEDFRQDIHSATYRCTASNSVGIIGSRDVNIRAVIRVKYEIRTYDDFVVKGNTAVLKCYVPSSVQDFVPVISWETDEGFTIQRSSSDSKYKIIADGSLMIEKADLSDGKKKYRCICKDEMDNESVTSIPWGQLIVTEPTTLQVPRIRSGSREHNYKVGATVELYCIAQGYPVPSYTWYKQEGTRMLPLSSNRRIQVLRSSLLIHKASKIDTATYVCVANNSAGEDRIHLQLVISEHLRASVYPEKLIVKEGISVTFTCNVTGPQITSLVWTKNLKPVITSARTKLISSEVLQIYSVMREDKGMYQCFVRSHDYSYQGSAQLSLEEDPPEFREIFPDRLLRPGAKTSLRCLVTGNPLPQVSWRLYSRPVVEGLGVRIGDFVDSQGLLMSFINISAVTSEHGGIYSCHARNEIGAISHSARLSVYGPPYIHPMDNITAVTGDEVNVDCAVSGHPLRSIRWRKDNTLLAGGQRLADHRNGTLSIAQAAKGDQGWYHCEVIGGQGEKAMGSLYIRVVERPVINPFIFGDELMEGMRTMVVCTVLAGESPINILWLKDSMPLLHSEHRDGIHVTNLGEFASSLTIPSVSRYHAGNYTCLVASGAAQASYTAVMNVKASPKWVKKPKDMEVIVNQKVVFTCQAEGIPEPIHRWKYRPGDGSAQPADFRSVVSSSHMYVLENGSLVIRDVEKQDAGLYLCEASNGVGESLSEVVKLTVNVPPRFNQSFEVKTVKEHEEVVLSCDAHGESPLTVSWKRYQRPIDRSVLSRYVLREHVHPNGLKSQLSIPSVLRADSGLFSCEASNDYGREEKSIQLIVQAPPESPEGMQLLQVTSRQITFSWTAPSSGNSPITGYIVVYNQSRKAKDEPLESVRVPATETKVTITGLNPGSTYVFKVHAENALGRSGPSQDLTITTEEEAPANSPQDVRVIPLSSSMVKVTWKAPSPSSLGYLLGFYVGYRDLSTNDPYVYKTVDISKQERLNEALISNLRRNTKYAITVQGYNSKGAGPASKEVIVQTLQHDPPRSPVLKVINTSEFSVELQWSISEVSPITGYVLLYKSESGDVSEESHVAPQRNSVMVKNLKCGTKYHFFLTAFNNAGRGEPSEEVTARTKGGAPQAPDKSALLAINSTYVVVRLSSWNDGGCPILYFEIRYKPKLQKEWILQSSNIAPAQATVTLSDLNPGTWYDLLMAAHNDADSTEAEYVFATLTASGATVPPLASTSSTSSGAFSILKDPAVFVPIVCAIVVVVVITVVVAVVMVLRRKDTTSECRSQGVYSGSSGGKGENLSMSSYGKVKRSDPSDDSQREPLYYPTPYATTQLSTYSESPNTSHCNTLRRHDGKGHEYDIPHRHAQMGEYTSYAKLWTRIHENIEVDGNVSMATMKANNFHLKSILGSYEDGASDMEEGSRRLTCPPHPDSADIDELSETECDRHHNSWIVIRESFEEDLIRRVPHVC